MNKALTSAWALAAVMVAATAAWGDSPSDPAAASISSRLESVRVSLQYDNAPFVDVIDSLSKASGINFAIDPRVFKETKPDYLNITMNIKDVPLKAALNVLLRPRGLAAELTEGALLVLPKSVQDGDVYLVMYDVRDLLAKIRDFPAPEMAIGFDTGEWSGG